MVTDALWSFKSIFQEGEKVVLKSTHQKTLNSEGKKVQIVTKINDILLWHQLKFLISDICMYAYIFPHFIPDIRLF